MSPLRRTSPRDRSARRLSAMASGHQQVNIEMRLRDKAGTSPTSMDVATSAEMYEAKPPPPIGWKQALAAGWTPALAGTPSTSKIAFYGREVLLGMIICMAQIPESIAFSYLARVRPPVALHSAWIVGLTCAVLGGRPGMVEGATGAFAAIINTFLGEPDVPGGNGAGIELVFASVMLAGVLMLLVWAFRLDRFISLLPLPVMVGFCNGLAIVIGIAQLHPFKVPKCGSCPAGATRNTGGDCVTACGDVVDGIGRRLESIVTPCTGSGWREGAELGWMLLILFMSMIIMEFTPKLPKPTDIAKKPVWQRPLAFLVEFILEIPSSVFSLGAAIALEFGLIRPLGYRTDTIGDQQRFTSSDAYPRPFFWEDSNPLYDYDISKIATWDGCRTILAQGVLLAAVGCIEGLMTAEVVTSYVKTPHHPGLVVGAMGVANILSGFMGGIGGNSMIGLSTIACINGGRGRVAPFCSALGILICISAAYSLLNYIPMAALAGIMLIVVFHTFKWFSIPLLLSALLPERGRTALSTRFFSWERKVVRMDVITMLITTILIAVSNIAVGVGVGLAVSCAVYAWDSASTLNVSFYHSMDPRSGKSTKVYQVRGPLFFGTSKKLLACFDAENDPESVIVIFTSGTVYDYTLMDTMAVIAATYHEHEKNVEFRQLNERSVRMMRKARVLTRHIEYQQDQLVVESEQSATLGEGESLNWLLSSPKHVIPGFSPNLWPNEPRMPVVGGESDEPGDESASVVVIGE